jgi:hypothetical protein
MTKGCSLRSNPFFFGEVEGVARFVPCWLGKKRSMCTYPEDPADAVYVVKSKSLYGISEQKASPRITSAENQW